MKQKMDSKCQSTLQFKSQKEPQFCSIMSDLWILMYFARKISIISNILHASAKDAKILPSLTHSIVLTCVQLVKRDLLLNMVCSHLFRTFLKQGFLKNMKIVSKIALTFCEKKIILKVLNCKKNIFLFFPVGF